MRSLKQVFWVDPHSPLPGENMADDEQKTASSADKAWPFVMSWAGRISALIGLFGALAGGVTWFINHHRQQVEHATKLAQAETQAKQGDYQAAIQSYGDLLKTDPLDRSALDGQLNSTMQWVEDFHVAVAEGQSASNAAGPALDEMMTLLEAGLARSKGTQAADVQAHLGWAHWLNQHIAEREFGPAAEQNLRAALASDPTNVYANAMLGNWMLQTGGSVPDAIHFLDAAVLTGKARPFVRVLELGGLVGLDKAGTRGELIKVANDIRKSGEPLEEAQKRRLLAFCLDPIVTDRTELVESLTAAPSEEAWGTYLWLDDNPDDTVSDGFNREFIQANLLEATGKPQQALDLYRQLQQRLKNAPGSLQSADVAGVARLSQHQHPAQLQ